MKKVFLIIISAVVLFCSATAYAEIAEDDTINTAVVCYHSVLDNPFKWNAYCISSSEMEDDLKYLKENGYRTILPREMWFASEEDKNIVLTFDDGYEDFYYNVFPLLKKYNARAAIYIIGAKIGKKGFLNESQIKEMDESGLVEIGNHTYIMHTYGYRVSAFLEDTVLVNDYIEDVKDCSRRIFEITGHGTESLSFPEGQFTKEMDDIIHINLGYTTTFSTYYGIAKKRGDIFHAVSRLYRNHGVDMSVIEGKINSLK